MEFCKVSLTFESADDSYDVTIHMKARYLYLHMVLDLFLNGTVTLKHYNEGLNYLHKFC